MFFRVSLTFLLFTSKLTHLVYFYFYLKLYNYHNLKYLCPIQHAHYKRRLVFFVNVSGVIIFLEVSPSVYGPYEDHFDILSARCGCGHGSTG